MQESIPIASFRFQQVMVTIFEDFLEWMIVIIDNLLILATDYQDLYEKVVLVVRRCIKHNVFLKFEKSFLGVKFVKFFRFECIKGSFEMTDERKQQIQQIPRPMTKKGMQSLQGTTVICSKFISNYSVHFQALYSMTTMDYDWKSCWNPTEIAAFDDLKQAVLDCCALPNSSSSKQMPLPLAWATSCINLTRKLTSSNPSCTAALNFLILQLAGQLSNQNVTASMVVLKQLSHTFLQDHSFCTTTIRTSKP